MVQQMNFETSNPLEEFPRIKETSLPLIIQSMKEEVATTQETKELLVKIEMNCLGKMQSELSKRHPRYHMNQLYEWYTICFVCAEKLYQHDFNKDGENFVTCNLGSTMVLRRPICKTCANSEIK